MMRKMSPEDVAMVQTGHGGTSRSPSPTLKTINVPTLLLTGDEDMLTGWRKRSDAPEYRWKPVENNFKSGPLFAVGAA